MQEVLEERDLYPAVEPIEAPAQAPAYASLPALDTKLWRAMNPPTPTINRDGTRTYTYGQAPLILYLVRQVDGWCYLHAIDSDECLHQLAPDKQDGLVYHDLSCCDGYQHVLGQLIECHGSVVTPVDGGPSIRVGKWIGDDSDQYDSQGISFVGHYSGSPCGHWVISYNRQRDDRTIPSTKDLTFNLGNLPEELNANYHRRY